MNGLLRMDLLCIRKTIVLMAAVGVLLTLAFRNLEDGMVMVPIMICSSLVGTAQAYNDECGWLTYATSTGVKRSEHIRQKYVLGAITLLVGLVAGVISILVNQLIEPWETDLNLAASFAVMGVLCGFMTIGISMYVGQRFGGRYLGLVFAVVIGIIAGLSAGLSVVGIDMTAMTMMLVLDATLVVIDVAIYIVNLRFIEKKDF